MKKLLEAYSTIKLFFELSKEITTTFIHTYIDSRYNQPEPRPRCLFCRQELKVTIISKGNFSAECKYCVIGNQSAHNVTIYDNQTYLEHIETTKYKLGLYENSTYAYKIVPKANHNNYDFMFRLNYQVNVDHQSMDELDAYIERLIQLQNFF